MQIKEAAEDWVLRALVSEQIANAEALTPALIAIAEQHHVLIEDLIRWIHDRWEGKQWTAETWERWCTKYDDTRAKLKALYQRPLQQIELCRECGHPIHDDEYALLCSSDCGITQ